jgi:hypothetical protein
MNNTTRAASAESKSAAIPAARVHNVHLVLQGKGGVGKSSTAAFLAQFLATDPQRRATCIDTDPVNGSFTAYKTLDVKRVEIMTADDAIDPRRFDDVIELIVSQPRDVVIDNGASSFVALAHYLLSSHIPSLLDEHGRLLVLHVVVVGGPAMRDTLAGLRDLLQHFPAPCRFVVWLNPFFGPVRSEDREFEELKVYTEHRDRISALIKLPTLQTDTFGADLRALLTARRTFSEALDDRSLGIVTKQRLKLIQKKVFAQLEAASAAGLL